MSLFFLILRLELSLHFSHSIANFEGAKNEDGEVKEVERTFNDSVCVRDCQIIIVMGQ